MSLNITEEELRKIVVKESSSRLKLELGVGQRVLSESQITSLDRKHLVAYIVAMRSMALQQTPVKILVSGFDPNKVKVLGEIDAGEECEEQMEAEASEVKGDSYSMMMQMMMMFQKEAREDRERVRVA